MQPCHTIRVLIVIGGPTCSQKSGAAAWLRRQDGLHMSVVLSVADLQETRRLAKARLGYQSSSTEPVFNPVELSASALPINGRLSDSNVDVFNAADEPEVLIGTQVHRVQSQNLHSTKPKTKPVSPVTNYDLVLCRS